LHLYSLNGFGNFKHIWKIKPIATGVYDGRMKSSPKRTPEYTNFENAMRAILRAPRADVERVLEEERAERAMKPKRGPKPHSSASDHVSSGGD